MAGRLGTVHGLVFGLVLVTAGSVALSQASNAESSGNRTAQGAPSVFSAPTQPSPQVEPARAGSNAQDAPTPEQVNAIAHVQTCLTELGYYKGPIDGKRGRETWTAYWNFKHDHGLGGYSDLLAEPVRQKLDELCIETAAIEPPPAQPAEPAATDAAPPAEPSSDEDMAEDEGPRLDIDCLPEDLLALLRRAHGAGVVVDRCAPSCLPPPGGLSQSQLDELQAKNGVAWCRTCVPIDGHLALDDVRRIERAGNLELCATPPRQLQRYGSGAGDPLKSYTRIRELYRALPPAEEDPDAVAVIIGNRNYALLPASETSQNDASAIYAFLTEHLGYRPDNIIDARDANQGRSREAVRRRGRSRRRSRAPRRGPAQRQGAGLLLWTWSDRRRADRDLSAPRRQRALSRGRSAATSCRRSTPISRGSTPSRCWFCWRRITGGITGPWCCRPTCRKR